MFYLPYQAPENPKKIDYTDSILLLGSCFSDNIGEKLIQSKFNVEINPFGTIYNPHSIFELLQKSLKADYTTYPVKSFDHYFDWNAHSKINESTEEGLKDSIAKVYKKTDDLLQQVTWIIVSPGTAFVYRLKETGQMVANCHKVPLKHFDKELLKADSIEAQFSEVKSSLTKVNKNVKWLFTVSPVRHIRDGLVENNRSKSILIDAIHRIVETHDDCYYFPSYEILIDQLRDYRYYKEDMIHPTDQAIDYIWDQFTNALLTKESQSLLTQWNKIFSSLQHRPRNAASGPHQKFIKETILKLKQLENTLDITQEMESLKKQLIHESP